MYICKLYVLNFNVPPPPPPPPPPPIQTGENTRTQTDFFSDAIGTPLVDLGDRSSVPQGQIVQIWVD